MKILLVTTIFLISASSATPHDPKTSRILGGTAARAGQFPFAASITYRTTQGQFFCAGTLIDNQWIITAGHCVIDAIQFDINLGTNNRLGTGGETFSTADYILYEDYSALPLLNDIGLVKLRMPITFTDYMQPIHVVGVHDVWPNSTLEAIGWGSTSDDDASFSAELNFVSLVSISNEDCQSVYGNQITDEKICVVGNNNEGTCGGDSGGALIQYSAAGASMLIGVSSFISQNGCDNPDPSGFTRIYPFVDWLRNHTST